MNVWHDVATGANPPDDLNAIIEIPRGSRNKFELDKETGLFRFDRLLYSAVHYPGDYGFLPRTLAGDEDPLDVLVMTTEPTFTGCLMEVRPLAVFEMQDDKGLDEKILAVPRKNPRFAQLRDLEDVGSFFLREVEHFFAIYKELEGARTTVQGWKGLDRAREIIRGAQDAYAAAFGDRSV